MRDEIDARIWAEHGEQFSDQLHRFLVAVKVTFCRMAAVNFAAPWRRPAKDC